MRTVPELVFVNCCHLAARSASEVLSGTYDRARFAANVAEELIEIGVRCVIAAGWAVEDEPAKIFATTFYDALLRGRRFVDAVAEARRLRMRWAATPGPRTSAMAILTGSSGAALAMRSIRRHRWPMSLPASRRRWRWRWRSNHWRSRAGTRRRLGNAAREDPPSRRTLRRVVGCDGRSRRVIRIGVGRDEGDGGSDRVVPQGACCQRRQCIDQGGRTARQSARAACAARPCRAAHKESEPATRAQLAQARSEIRAALATLEGLTQLQPSIERQNLCGSAWKRLALVEAIAKRPNEERIAISNMKASYARAEALARATNFAALFYPALNRMAAELIVDAGKPGWTKFDSATLDDVRESLTLRARDDPDFWSFIGMIELRTYQAMAEQPSRCRRGPASSMNSTSFSPGSARHRCGARCWTRRRSCCRSTPRAPPAPRAAPRANCWRGCSVICRRSDVTQSVLPTAG